SRGSPQAGPRAPNPAATGSARRISHRWRAGPQRAPRSDNKLMMPSHGNQRFTASAVWSIPAARIELGALGEAGPDATARSRLFESFGVPRDPRGIVLLCGYLVCRLLLEKKNITTPVDPLVWGY